MKTNKIGNIVDSIRVRRFVKPAVLLISALFIMSIALTFMPISVQAQTAASTMPGLHTSGNQILDANNNVVYLRGMGRTGDLQSASGMWSGQGMSTAAWGQKWQSISSNIPLMDQTFQSYQQIWHVNNIRLLIPVNWWWTDNVAPSNFDSGASSTPISYRTYIETVVQEAAKYGIYVDICPYNVFDGYTDNSGGNVNGIPGSLGANANNYMLSINSNGELQAWQTWWTSLASRLGQYPNVIFEAWNEPTTTGNSPVPASYMNYLSTMYSTVRSSSQNLILMQWDVGYIPNYNDLSWASQITSAIPNSVNLAFTTHAYRHAPYFNTQWATTYSGVKPQLQAGIASMGVTAPLVFNEAGSCMNYVSSSDVQNELNWWDGFVHSASDLGVGVTAYYWMSDADLGPIYSGESLLSGIWAQNAASPTPNAVGQIFLNYAPVIPVPTPIAMPTSTPAPTSAPASTPTTTPAPTATTTPTPEPTPDPTSTPAPAPEIITTSPPTNQLQQSIPSQNYAQTTAQPISPNPTTQTNPQ